MLKKISIGSNAPEKFNVVIEIPKGSSNKYEVDKETGMITLDRVFYSPFYYPADYGYLPETHWYDGDPLDALVFTTHPLLPGIVAEARAIGVIRMVDGGDRDEKIIAVATKDPRFADYKDLSDVPEHIIKEIKHFYEHYKDLEGKKVEITGIEGREAAINVIKEGMELNKKK